MKENKTENSPVKAQNDLALAQPPRETSRDSENNQTAQTAETEKEAAVASSALVRACKPPEFGNIKCPRGYGYHVEPNEKTIDSVIEWIEMMIRGGLADWPQGFSIDLDMRPIIPPSNQVGQC